MNAKELFEKGQHLMMGGNYKESIKAFIDAEAAGYDSDIVSLSTGVAHFKLKEYDEVLEDFTCSIDEIGKRERGYFYRGVTHMAKEEFEEAVSDFSKTIELDPQNGFAFFSRAVSYSRQGKDEEAAKDYKSALMNSESTLQGFSDTFGIVRTEFNKVESLLLGEREPYTATLTNEEIERLKDWIAEL